MPANVTHAFSPYLSQTIPATSLGGMMTAIDTNSAGVTGAANAVTQNMVPSGVATKQSGGSRADRLEVHIDHIRLCHRLFTHQSHLAY